MAVDARLKAWVQHFQKRIILVENPDPRNMVLLRLLTKIACDESCITETCNIEKYLDCNLPPLCPPKLGNMVITDKCKILVGDCQDFDIEVRVTFRDDIPQVILKPDDLTFEAGKFYFECHLLIPILQNNEDFFLPQVIDYSVYVKEKFNSSFVNTIPNTSLGLISSYEQLL